MYKDPLQSNEKTQINFTSVPALSPPIIFMIVSNFDKSYERQAKQKKKVIDRHCAPSRTQNKAETNILTICFFHCFNIAYCNSSVYTVSNLSHSVRATITERAVRLFHQPWFVHHRFVLDSKLQLTGWQFVQFTQWWKFTHSTSSPYHSQSNVNTELGAEMTETLLKKAANIKENLWQTIS